MYTVGDICSWRIELLGIIPIYHFTSLGVFQLQCNLTLMSTTCHLKEVLQSSPRNKFFVLTTGGPHIKNVCVT